MKVIEDFNRYISEWNGSEVLGKGAITGVLEKACGSTSRRHQFLEKLIGKKSSRDLTEAEWFALGRLVRPYKPENGHWTTECGESVLKSIVDGILS